VKLKSKKITINIIQQEMKKILIALFVILGFASSCNDDSPADEPTTQLTTAQKVQNNWTIDLIWDVVYDSTSTTVDYNDTIISGSGNTMDFRSDNKAYVVWDGDMDTIDYQIVNDQTLEFDGDVFTITSLTTSEFVFVYKERNDDPYFDNYVRLKR